jgi:hypothetical protein
MMFVIKNLFLRIVKYLFSLGILIGLTHELGNSEPLQAQRAHRNQSLRDILRKSYLSINTLFYIEVGQSRTEAHCASSISLVNIN